MLLFVTFTFLILNIPTRTLVFYLTFYVGNSPHYYASLHLLYQIGIQTYYTNHAINFFLYVMSGEKFRRDLRNMFIRNKSKTNESLHSNCNTLTSSIEN